MPSKQKQLVDVLTKRLVEAIEIEEGYDDEENVVEWFVKLDFAPNIGLWVACVSKTHAQQQVKKLQRAAKKFIAAAVKDMKTKSHPETKTIMSIARGVRRNYPKNGKAGCCEEASKALAKAFKVFPTLGATVVNGYLFDNDHTWCEIRNSEGGTMIVDVTADRFGTRIPAVVLDLAENLPQYSFDAPVRHK